MNLRYRENMAGRRVSLKILDQEVDQLGDVLLSVRNPHGGNAMAMHLDPFRGHVYLFRPDAEFAAASKDKILTGHSGEILRGDA